MKPLAVVIAFVGLLSLFWWASRNQDTRRQRIRWTIVVGTAMLLGALGVVLFPRSAALLIVLGLIGLVGIGVIASLLYLAWLVIVSLNRRKYAERRDLALSQDWYRELKEGITGATRDRVVELEALGFQRTLDFRTDDATQGSILIRERGPIYAEVSQPPPGTRPGSGELITELTTHLANNVGLVCTSTYGFALASPDMLLQVFPTAASDELMRHHERAIAWVRARGIAIEPASRQVVHRCQLALAAQYDAAVRAPHRDTSRELWRIAKGIRVHLGAVDANSTMKERLEKITIRSTKATQAKDSE